MQSPPEMEKVEEIALAYLDCTAYHPWDMSKYIKTEKTKRRKRKTVRETEEEQMESSEEESSEDS